MRILAGVIPTGQFSGTVRLSGSAVAFSDVLDAERQGVVMIPQELAVVPAMSVAENLMRNREPNRFGLIDTAALEARVQAILAEFGIEIDARRPMRELGLAQQQLIEIAKALSKSALVVILDEPTASLTRADAEGLFDRLRDLRARGYLCLYISHRIDEVLAIADRVAVLRDGSLAGIVPATDATHAGLVGLMLGRRVGEVYPSRVAPEPAPPTLAVRHLSVEDPVVPGRKLVDDVSFEVRPGEIVGLFGLVGAGRTELAMTIFGDPPGEVGGEVSVDGRSVAMRGPREAMAAGIALVTEDRRRYGFIPAFGPRANISLASLDSLSRWGRVDRHREEVFASAIAQTLRLRAASLEQPVSGLSGGNQQKVVLGKWLGTTPRVLVLDEPTRGVDVGARVDVYRLLAELADQGVAVLLISSEAEEVTGLADRILVMSRGRVVGEGARGTSQDELLRLATGGSSAATHDGALA
jgi:D-xylose transport system ATP-binding protein